MNSPQAAEDALACTAVSAASLDCEDDGAEGRRPKLIPAAEAVATTATPAMATAPTANPATRRRRSFQSLVIMHPTVPHGSARLLYAFVSRFSTLGEWHVPGDPQQISGMGGRSQGKGGAARSADLPGSPRRGRGGSDAAPGLLTPASAPVPGSPRN